MRGAPSWLKGDGAYVEPTGTPSSTTLAHGWIVDGVAVDAHQVAFQSPVNIMVDRPVDNTGGADRASGAPYVGIVKDGNVKVE